MMLSKRERMILVVAVVAVVGLIGHKFVFTPVSARLAELESRKLQLQDDLHNAQLLFRQRASLERKWRAMLGEGLRSDAEAESRIARAIDRWSQDTRLALSSVKPERIVGDEGLNEMTFVVVGRGTMRSVARFLWQVETAALPIKVKNMQLGLMSESADSMSLELRLSALYESAEQKPPANKQSQQQQPEANDEQALL